MLTDLHIRGSMYPGYTACCCLSPRVVQPAAVLWCHKSRFLAISIFSTSSFDLWGTEAIQDPQNAQKLCRRAILLSGSLFMCILWLYIPHGSDNASVMAAAAVVSMGERSIDFIVAPVAPGEKNTFRTLLLVFLFFKLSFKWFFFTTSDSYCVCSLNNKLVFIFFSDHEFRHIWWQTSVAYIRKALLGKWST